MDRSLFRFIIRYSRRDQLLIVPLVVATMVVYYLSLDLPKTIINQAIQGGRFPQPDATTRFLGLELGRIDYLLALSLIFLALIVLNGGLKYQINTMKGWMGERMLRRLRYALFDYVLRFPLTRFRRVKAAEMATMIKDEVEPLGGFIGEALITPLFLGGQALTALFFILYQHAALGMIALGVVAVQAFFIPKLRRRLLVLGRERQLTARALAGRIAEAVDGAAEIHANDTSNYERAEISARLGRIFRIRFEFFQRKFLIKFLNNFLSQVTPFLFYTVGGYLVIVGRLDIGALVAVIAAYKDLPTPVKELIDWDQQRLDVQIKYQQVMEVFADEQVEPAERQALIEAPKLPQKGRLRVSNLSLLDEGGARLVNDVSFECALEQHVGIVGRHGAGASELALLLARLVPPSGGSIELGGIDITRAPEAVTGRALGYVGAPAYLFPVSVRDNVLYGLKHRPVRPRTYEGEAAREHEFQLREANRTGGSVLDVSADWIDYAAAGVADAEALEARVIALLRVVDLEETIFELGLRSAPDSERNPGLAEQVLAARQHMRERLQAFRDTARRVAHEMRGPLNAAQLALGRLATAEGDARHGTALAVLREETERLRRLADEFALFGRLPEGPEIAIDVNELVDGVLTAAVPSDCPVSRRIEPGLRVRGRYEVLRRAVENVVRNAVEATDARGITVRATRADGTVRLTIADSGPGVPEAERERIFQPYVTTKTKGTGLGLAIARQAAGAHGGSLVVDAEPRGGAAFTFSLPAA